MTDEEIMKKAIELAKISGDEGEVPAECLAGIVYRFKLCVVKRIFAISRLFLPVATISPFLVTTAPTGTSPS